MCRRLVDLIFIVLMLGMVSPALGKLVSPVHQYTFEDGTADDSVGDANGVLVGGAKIENGALVITAQDQWMEMPGSAIAMNTFKGVTIEAWYTPQAGANTSWSMLAYFGDSVNGLGSNGFFVTSARADSKSRAAISIGDIATPWASESGADGPEYDDGLQHHMVSTIDATNITLYIDGNPVGTTVLSATNKISGISPNFAYLAKGGYTGDPEWIGSIQQFSIYDYALSAAQVTASYAAGPDRTDVFESVGRTHTEGVEFVLAALQKLVRDHNEPLDRIDWSIVSDKIIHSCLQFNAATWSEPNLLVVANAATINALGAVNLAGDLDQTIDCLNLTPKQKELLLQIFAVLNDPSLSLDETLSRFASIYARVADEAASEEEAAVVYGTLSVGISSTQYWSENYDRWATLTSKPASLQAARNPYTWKDAAKADIAGAAGGGMAGLLLGGPAGAGAGAASGAIAGTTGSVVKHFLDKLF
jgi:hypothetical protein